MTTAPLQILQESLFGLVQKLIQHNAMLQQIPQDLTYALTFILLILSKVPPKRFSFVILITLFEISVSL